MAERQQEHQYRHDSESLSFPDDTVVGIVDDPLAAGGLLNDLVSAGIPQEEISLLYGDIGADRLDASGKRHGLKGKIQRLIQYYGDDDLPHVRRQADELRKGNFLVAAPAGDDERDAVVEMFAAHGGHFINHYSGWAVTRLRD